MQKKKEIGKKFEELNDPFFSKKIEKFMENSQNCLKHENEFSLYCLDDLKLCCLDCVFVEKTHKSHHIVSLKSKIPDLKKEILKFEIYAKEKLNNIDEGVDKCALNESFLHESLKNFCEKIDFEFGKIFEMVEKRHSDVLEKIKNVFAEKCQENKFRNDNLKYMKSSLINLINGFDNELEEQEHICYYYNLQKILKEIFKNTNLKVKVLTIEDTQIQDFSDKRKIKHELENFCRLYNNNQNCSSPKRKNHNHNNCLKENYPKKEVENNNRIKQKNDEHRPLSKITNRNYEDIQEKERTNSAKKYKNSRTNELHKQDFYNNMIENHEKRDYSPEKEVNIRKNFDDEMDNLFEINKKYTNKKLLSFSPNKSSNYVSQTIDQ